MQIRYRSTLSCEEYVATRAWRDSTARLEACPVYGPDCRHFARHGTYGRYTPWANIWREYCTRQDRTGSPMTASAGQGANVSPCSDRPFSPTPARSGTSVSMERSTWAARANEARVLGLRMCDAKNSTQAWHASSPRRAIGAGTRADSVTRAVAGADEAIRSQEPPVGAIRAISGSSRHF